jgi:Phage tail tube protein
MGKAIGVEIKAAVKKASAWGTAVECGAGDGILILPHSIKKDRPNMTDDSLGLYFPQAADSGEIKVEGSLPMYLRYDSIDLLIAMAMGATGGAPAQQGATTAYAQTFTLADSLDDLFVTFCVNNNINIDEFTTMKVTGMTIKGEVGKALQVSFDVIAIDKETGSAVNTSVTFANVTIGESGNRVLFGDGVFRLNAQDGAALGAGDKVYPSDFELALKRNMAGVYGVSSGSDYIDEPTNNGQPAVTLKLDFPRYTAATYFTDWDAGTNKKMDMTFTGGLIEGAYYRTFTITLPNLKIANVDAPVNQGIIKHPLEFVCLGCSAAPTGMTGITLPFQVDVINQETADVLA